MKSGTFSRATWEFDVVLNLKQQEIPEQKRPRSMTSLQYLLSFAPTLDNFKTFQWTRNTEVLLNTDD